MLQQLLIVRNIFVSTLVRKAPLLFFFWPNQSLQGHYKWMGERHACNSMLPFAASNSAQTLLYFIEEKSKLLLSKVAMASKSGRLGGWLLNEATLSISAWEKTWRQGKFNVNVFSWHLQSTFLCPFLTSIPSQRFSLNKTKIPITNFQRCRIESLVGYIDSIYSISQSIEGYLRLWVYRFDLIVSSSTCPTKSCCWRVCCCKKCPQKSRFLQEMVLGWISPCYLLIALKWTSWSRHIQSKNMTCLRW